jgi:phage terminase large subunit-like protein
MYYRLRADRIVAEANNGGEMVELTLKTIDPTVPVTLVHASRNKVTRAEPVAAIYEQNRAHHVGNFHKLEDEMCLYEPGQPSPNRMDALVWAGTHLMLGSGPGMNDWISALKKRTESEDDLL